MHHESSVVGRGAPLCQTLKVLDPILARRLHDAGTLCRKIKKYALCTPDVLPRRTHVRALFLLVRHPLHNQVNDKKKRVTETDRYVPRPRWTCKWILGESSSRLPQSRYYTRCIVKLVPNHAKIIKVDVHIFSTLKVWTTRVVLKHAIKNTHRSNFLKHDTVTSETSETSETRQCPNFFISLSSLCFIVRLIIKYIIIKIKWLSGSLLGSCNSSSVLWSFVIY